MHRRLEKITILKFATAFACLVFLGLGIAIHSASAQVSATGSASNSTATLLMVLQPGDEGVAVSALQQLLINKGYLSVSAPTGYFGAMTKAAVIAFQKAHGFPETGVMTVPVTGEAKFFAAAAPSSFRSVAVGSSGSGVKSLQQFLIQQGLLNVSSTTSYFGSLTKAALLAFQKEKNLPETGVLDQATFAAMNGQ